MEKEFSAAGRIWLSRGLSKAERGTVKTLQVQLQDVG